MISSLIIFIVLFVVIFVMHKPFDVHSSNRKWLNNLHIWLEYILIIQGVLLINMLFLKINAF